MPLWWLSFQLYEAMGTILIHHSCLIPYLSCRKVLQVNHCWYHKSYFVASKRNISKYVTQVERFDSFCMVSGNQKQCDTGLISVFNNILIWVCCTLCTTTNMSSCTRVHAYTHMAFFIRFTQRLVSFIESKWLYICKSHGPEQCGREKGERDKGREERE